MNEKETKSFVLENSLAAASAFLKGGKIYASDGIEKKIYVFGEDGEAEVVATARAYRRIRADISSGGKAYTAIGDRRKRIYMLDGNFRETGFWEPDADTERGFSEFCDAGTLTVGGNRFFIGAFRQGAYFFDEGGKRLGALYRVAGSSCLTDFAAVTADYFAASRIECGTRFLTVCENGNEVNAIFPRGFSLRTLFPADDGIYALYGSGYIYNRVARIYSGGKLELSHLK